MAEMLIDNWGGISDDPFLVRENECLDMDGIDIRTTPRRIKGALAFLGTYATELSPYNDTLNHVTESIDGVVQSYNSHCYIGGANIDTLVAGADIHATVGSNLSDYNASTNSEGVRHFFFNHDNSTNPIKIIGFVAGVRAVITTTNTSGGASPANIPAGLRTTAECTLWKGAMIFARGNKIYEINPDTATLSAGAKIELEIGAVIKAIYYYNGMITIVYNIGNDCYIRGCTYDGTTYKLQYYADISIGEKCITSTMNRGIIYWVSTSGIFAYNGQSQLVKTYPFHDGTICAYNKGVLRIADGTDFIEYGVNKPGYGNPLTLITSPLTITGVTQNYIITFQSGLNKFRLDSGGAYKANNYYITAPYTAGRFGILKKGLGINIGHRFSRLSGYTDSSIQESITIAVQTDLMERVNASTYVTVKQITDLDSVKTDIGFQEITKALETAGYTCDFGYIRFKITLTSGDPYASYGNTLFRKSPEVYDFYISHDNIQQK